MGYVKSQGRVAGSKSKGVHTQGALVLGIFGCNIEIIFLFDAWQKNWPQIMATMLKKLNLNMLTLKTHAHNYVLDHCFQCCFCLVDLQGQYREPKTTSSYICRKKQHSSNNKKYCSILTPVSWGHQMRFKSCK